MASAARWRSFIDTELAERRATDKILGLLSGRDPDTFAARWNSPAGRRNPPFH